MRITGQDNVNTINKSQTQGVFDPPKPANLAGRASRSSEGSPTDQIDLGSQSGLLSQAQSAPSDDRAARLDQLRALVQSGQYQVDSRALSQSIVSAALSDY